MGLIAGVVTEAVRTATFPSSQRPFKGLGQTSEQRAAPL